MPKLKSGQWVGSYVVRGGSLKDKHGNITKTPITLRQRESGIVVDKYGNFKGFEKPHKHIYGTDIHKGKKPATFVKPNRLGSLKKRGSHIRHLK